jgi:hypothetical protein
MCFYRRFADRAIAKMFLYTIYSMLALEIASMITASSLIFTMCLPFGSFWNMVDPAWAAVHSYKCLPRALLICLASTISAMQDFAATLLPLPLVWSIAVTRRQKFLIGGVVFRGHLLGGSGDREGLGCFEALFGEPG